MFENYLIVLAEGGLHLRSLPEIEPTNVIGVIPDGQAVRIVGSSCDWFSVACHLEGEKRIGWANGGYLVAPEKYEPHFVVGEPNRRDSANTLAVRAVINDEFGGGRHKWDLQCTEYVQFRLHQLGIDIDWPIRHSRNGGRWANIFAEHEKYRVLSEPKKHCAVSFTNGIIGGVGHVAVVERVNKDESIKISEANWPGEGMYNERVLSRPEWQDKYRGQFIAFA